MIPRAHVTAWRSSAPWPTDAQIEQDLILSRAIVEMFSRQTLVQTLAFRGGTVLHKLFLKQPGRYSEDIDLVQTDEGAIGPVMEAIRAIHAGRATLVSTGTGSGKTECFLYPIVSKSLEMRDAGEPVGISAVMVYPMNALAEDQRIRLRSLLAGTGVPFGMVYRKLTICSRGWKAKVKSNRLGRCVMQSTSGMRSQHTYLLVPTHMCVEGVRRTSSVCERLWYLMRDLGT